MKRPATPFEYGVAATATFFVSGVAASTFFFAVAPASMAPDWSAVGMQILSVRPRQPS